MSFPRRLATAALSATAVAVIIGAGLFGDHSYSPIAGDQLGPDPEESCAGYQQRTEQALAQLSPQEQTYALVSFSQPQRARAAASAVAAAPRLNAMILGASAPIALPEPAPTETISGRSAGRAAVIAREIDRYHASLGPVIAPDTLSAVVVYASGAELSEIAQQDNSIILAVEPAPVDSAWGNFAIRPVSAVLGPCHD